MTAPGVLGGQSARTLWGAQPYAGISGGLATANASCGCDSPRSGQGFSATLEGGLYMPRIASLGVEWTRLGVIGAASPTLTFNDDMSGGYYRLLVARTEALQYVVLKAGLGIGTYTTINGRIASNVRSASYGVEVRPERNPEGEITIFFDLLQSHQGDPYFSKITRDSSGIPIVKSGTYQYQVRAVRAGLAIRVRPLLHYLGVQDGK